MYKRFRIRLHKNLDRPFTTDSGFIIAILMYLIETTIGIPGAVFETIWQIVFFILLLRPWWNQKFGFPYDEEKNE